MNRKYKVLIAGRNEAAIEDFFTQMNESFEVVTTSMRYADISSHISFFRPDVFVYCLYNESRDDLAQIGTLKLRLSSSGIPLAILGAREDCDEFKSINPGAADLALRRPISVGAIQNKIIELVKDQRFASAVDAINEEQAAKESAAKESADRTERRRVVREGNPWERAARKSADNEEAAVEQALFVGDSGPKAEKKAADGKRKHILVVDDNTMMLKMIKEHLHNQYDVATAASGRVALKFLERKKTDLILLDYEMPEESGPVVLEKLRASEATKDIPVIFLTGVTETRKIKEALALKPQNYLLKPVDREKLFEAIEKTFD